MSSEARQPLLEAPDRPLLLEGPEDQASTSETANGRPNDGRSPEQRLQEEEDAKYARGASRVVTYTVWFLLAAVMIGTIVGIVLVTIPMQQGSIPGPRKSAALLVISEDKPDNQVLGLRKGGKVEDDKIVEVVIWSGKGRHSTVPFNDLYSFSAVTTMWNELSSDVKIGDEDDAPVQRWKAVTLHEDNQDSMIIHGGDPLAADGAADHYMDDTWRLSLAELKKPVWSKLETMADNGSDVKPEARRAHVGVIFDVDDVPTLVIYGGRAKSGELLSDVWSTPLNNLSHLEWRLKRNLPELETQELSDNDNEINNDSEVANFESDENDSAQDNNAEENIRNLSKKHHKKSEKNYPPARKGHLGVSIPDNPHEPLMVVLGGRNDTNYFDDMWEYNVKDNSWQHLEQYGKSFPTPRDHFGGFYHDGLIYIYGGRGSTTDEYVSARPLGDLWTYDIKTSEWTQLHPSGPNPIPRFLYSMDTYVSGDAVNGDLRFVIMGGEGPKSCYLNDLWEYSIALNKWKQWGALKTEPGREKCANL